MKSLLWAAGLCLAAAPPSRARAAEAVGSPCAGAISRHNVAACAVSASAAVQAELAAEDAARGRREAARPFLPSNPTLSGSVSTRSSGAQRATNWSVSLGQELELGGQSFLRTDAADGELRAQAHRVIAARRATAAQAWAAWFELLATRERLQLGLRLEQATTAVAATVRAMTANGLTSEIDADIADTAALRASRDRFALESGLAAASARLTLLTGVSTDPGVEGALDPLRLPAAGVAAQLPELMALAEQQAAADRRVELSRRERLPNPTVSLFVQNDGFDEQVYGVGLSLPVPLPQPVGRTRAGELWEARGLADRARAEANRLQRELNAERAAATAELDAANKTRALYGADRVQRTLTRLESIATQVRAARLPVRDALIGQQALVEQLKAEIDAREALCLASLRVAAVTGVALEGADL
ncbi:MAG: TolC family protein [Archangiaceae bacterium]|nr:TolC family protein [Archangiaceae bacterium]